MLVAQALQDRAPAKINLTLRVLGRRADGYHLLESLVAFADIGDRLELVPDERLGIDVCGPMCGALNGSGDNLVLKAARQLAERVPDLRVGRFLLDKHLPVASGVGGGSSDAAAALRLLAQLNGIDICDERVQAAARAVGADVLVCLHRQARVMAGIGEILHAPLALPSVPAILVNPNVPVATATVFSALGLRAGEDRTAGNGGGDAMPAAVDLSAFMASLYAGTNDLEAPAIRCFPVIADVLAQLRSLPGAGLARMSGSGATCFALFETWDDAARGAERLARAAPAWWVSPTRIGAPA